MKTAISIPDDLFEQADRLARRQGQSRSRLYTRAVREYVARHSPDEVTAALDAFCAENRAEIDPFVVAATLDVLGDSEW